MSNFAEDIEKAADGEKIIAVVIGEMGWGDYDKQIKGKKLSWKKARPMLNYDYSTGFGAPECNAVYVWTTTKVIYVVQYDGSTCLSVIPRIPCDVMPEMPGG